MLLGSLLHLTQGGSPRDQQGLHWGRQTHSPHSCRLCCHHPAIRDMSALVCTSCCVLHCSLHDTAHFVLFATLQHSMKDSMGFEVARLCRVEKEEVWVRRAGRGLFVLLESPCTLCWALCKAAMPIFRELVIGFIQLMGKPYDISFSNQLTVYAASSLQ